MARVNSGPECNVGSDFVDFGISGVTDIKCICFILTIWSILFPTSLDCIYSMVPDLDDVD